MLQGLQTLWNNRRTRWTMPRFITCSMGGWIWVLRFNNGLTSAGVAGPLQA